MINSPRSLARAFALSFLYYSDSDSLREIFEHNDLDKIPPDCVLEITATLKHKPPYKNLDDLFAGHVEEPEVVTV